MTHVTYFLLVYSYNKNKRCTNFSSLLWNKILHVSDSISVHHQESSTVHAAIGTCHTGLVTHSPNLMMDRDTAETC